MRYELMSAEFYSAALMHHFSLFLRSLCLFLGAFIYNSWVKVVCLFVESPTRLCVNYWGVALLSCLGSFTVLTSLLTVTVAVVA